MVPPDPVVVVVIVSPFEPVVVVVDPSSDVELPVSLEPVRLRHVGGGGRHRGRAARGRDGRRVLGALLRRARRVGCEVAGVHHRRGRLVIARAAGRRDGDVAQCLLRRVERALHLLGVRLADVRHLAGGHALVGREDGLDHRGAGELEALGRVGRRAHRNLQQAGAHQVQALATLDAARDQVLVRHEGGREVGQAVDAVERVALEQLEVGGHQVHVALEAREQAVVGRLQPRPVGARRGDGGRDVAGHGARAHRHVHDHVGRVGVRGVHAGRRAGRAGRGRARAGRVVGAHDAVVLGRDGAVAVVRRVARVAVGDDGALAVGDVVRAEVAQVRVAVAAHELAAGDRGLARAGGGAVGAGDDLGDLGGRDLLAVDDLGGLGGRGLGRRLGGRRALDRRGVERRVRGGEGAVEARAHVVVAQDLLAQHLRQLLSLPT
ncbi:hypothetical protein ON010_g18308 [Phytophthora cinnamomi]|nr:hypothetical protein ON010_g18308 [Phytophthora cinnamomi]